MFLSLLLASLPSVLITRNPAFCFHISFGLSVRGSRVPVVISLRQELCRGTWCDHVQTVSTIVTTPYFQVVFLLSSLPLPSFTVYCLHTITCETKIKFSFTCITFYLFNCFNFEAYLILSRSVWLLTCYLLMPIDAKENSTTTYIVYK